VRLGVGAGDVDVDNDRFYTISLGITYHFATPKSLKKQLRDDRLALFD
jgi:hypothetical protein